VRASALAVMVLVTVALGIAAAESPRDRALADLRRTDPTARRAAVQTLAEAGEMADLAALAALLRDPDPAVRVATQEAMWQVWSRSGDKAIDQLFATGVDQLRQRDLDGAVGTFSQVIKRKPDFAEGWNKRATLYFMLGEYTKSLADCDEVIRRNPYHWGALSGYGMIYLQLDQPARALEYFEKALAVNPNLSRLEDTVEELRTLVIQRRKDSI